MTTTGTAVPAQLLALSATAAAGALAVAAVHAAQTGRDRRQALLERLEASAPGARPPQAGRGHLARFDAAVRRTRYGRRLAVRLAAAGVDRTPGEFTGCLAAAVAALWLLAAVMLAPFFGPPAGALAAWSGYAFLNWRSHQRTERFIGQLPELARLLANGSSAGLALRTAISMAADELEAPAGEELARVADALAVGHPLAQALGALRDRLPSRELAVLVTTLVLAGRSGGTLVESLRNLTETLEERKETRREVRTQVSQVMATAYAVPAIGFAFLLLLDRMTPGALGRMTGSWLGQAAVVVSFALYGLGFLVIRGMARIDV
jgi:tight adherence protein B